MILYRLTNLVNGKAYVGITTMSLRRRVGRHCCDSIAPKTAIGRALRKYGRESFRAEVLARATTWSQLQQMERGAIAEHGTFHKNGGYNLTLGGEGVLGYKWSIEHRKKMSMRQGGYRHTAAARLRIAAANGPQTEETKRKIGAANRGNTLGSDAIERRNISRLKKNGGNYHSPEGLASMKSKLTGRPHPHSPDAIAKMSDAAKCRVYTKSDRKRMSEGAKNRKKQPAAKEVRVAGVVYPSRKAAQEALGWSNYRYNIARDEGLVTIV